jgi:protein-disulfide isomerase
MKNKWVLTAIIIIISMGVVMAVRSFQKPKAFVYDPIESKSKGNKNAPLQLVEYIDYQCPACRQASIALDHYFEKYPGQIHVTVKIHPLSGHAHGLESAVYSECAARQDKFWAYHDLLFQNQSTWAPKPEAKPDFEDYAHTVGADMAALKACVEDPAVPEKLNTEKEEAKKLGVNLTPSFFYNGEFIVGFEQLNYRLEEYFKGQGKKES